MLLRSPRDRSQTYLIEVRIVIYAYWLFSMLLIFSSILLVFAPVYQQIADDMNLYISFIDKKYTPRTFSIYSIGFLLSFPMSRPKESVWSPLFILQNCQQMRQSAKVRCRLAVIDAYQLTLSSN